MVFLGNMVYIMLGYLMQLFEDICIVLLVFYL